MTFLPRYQGLDTSRNLSAAIWQDCKPMNGVEGPFFFDDFLGFDGSVAAQVGRYSSGGGGWRSFETTTNGTILPIGINGANTDVGGIIELKVAADNAEALITPSGVGGANYRITSASDKALWYEARVRTGATAGGGAPALTAHNIFVGLAEEGLAVTTGLFSAAGALPDEDYVAFAVRADGTSTLEAVHRKNGQALTDNGDAQVLVAGTWYKLGIKYDPYSADGQRVRYFVNGVPVITVASAAIAAATFPSGEKLAPYFGITNGSASTIAMQVDWVAVACNA